VALTEDFFEPDFVAFWPVSFLQQTSLQQTVSELDRHNRYIDIELIYKLQEMQSMVLTLGNGQILLGTPPVVLQFIFVFFHFVVCNCLFAKNIRSPSDIGKMTECF